MKKLLFLAIISMSLGFLSSCSDEMPEIFNDEANTLNCCDDGEPPMGGDPPGGGNSN